MKKSFNLCLDLNELNCKNEKYTGVRIKSIKLNSVPNLLGRVKLNKMERKQ